MSQRRAALCSLLLTWLRMRKIMQFHAGVPKLRGYGREARMCIESGLAMLTYVSWGGNQTKHEEVSYMPFTCCRCGSQTIGILFVTIQQQLSIVLTCVACARMCLYSAYAVCGV